MLKLEHAVTGFAQQPEPFLLRFGVRNHRAELVDRERAPGAADAYLAEDDRALGVEPDGNRDHDEERRDRQQTRRGGGYVEEPLERSRRARQSKRPDAEHREAVDVVELD